jgi:hypothetical protein
LRKIIDIVAGRGIDISQHIDLTKVEIIRLWTIADEKVMWDSCKFNIMTGKPVKTLDDLTLIHHKGVFLEDRMHDWNVYDGKLDYGSRLISPKNKAKILIEYEKKPPTFRKLNKSSVKNMINNGWTYTITICASKQIPSEDSSIIPTDFFKTLVHFDKWCKKLKERICNKENGLTLKFFLKDEEIKE